MPHPTIAVSNKNRASTTNSTSKAPFKFTKESEAHTATPKQSAKLTTDSSELDSSSKLVPNDVKQQYMSSKSNSTNPTNSNSSKDNNSNLAVAPLMRTGVKTTPAKNTKTEVTTENTDPHGRQYEYSTTQTPQQKTVSFSVNKTGVHNKHGNVSQKDQPSDVPYSLLQKDKGKSKEEEEEIDTADVEKLMENKGNVTAETTSSSKRKKKKRKEDKEEKKKKEKQRSGKKSSSECSFSDLVCSCLFNFFCRTKRQYVNSCFRGTRWWAFFSVPLCSFWYKLHWHSRASVFRENTSMNRSFPLQKLSWRSMFTFPLLQGRATVGACRTRRFSSRSCSRTTTRPRAPSSTPPAPSPFRSSSLSCTSRTWWDRIVLQRLSRKLVCLPVCIETLKPVMPWVSTTFMVRFCWDFVAFTWPSADCAHQAAQSESNVARCVAQ